MNGLCSGYGNVDFITCMGERTDQSSRIVLKINRRVRKTRQEGYLEDSCGIWFLVLFVFVLVLGPHPDFAFSPW